MVANLKSWPHEIFLVYSPWIAWGIFFKVIFAYFTYFLIYLVSERGFLTTSKSHYVHETKRITKAKWLAVEEILCEMHCLIFFYSQVRIQLSSRFCAAEPSSERERFLFPEDQLSSFSRGRTFQSTGVVKK